MSGSEKLSSFVGIQYLICECGQAFQSEEKLRAHLEQKHPRLQQKAFVRRLKRVPPPITEYKCGECGKIYSTEEECVAHQEIDHIPYMEEEVVYQEDENDVEASIIPDIIVPSASQSSSPSLRVQAGNGNSNDTTKRQRKPPALDADGNPIKKKKTYKYKNVVCDKCGKSYGSAAAMHYHQRVHTGVKPYKCQYCPKAFTMAMFLQVHIRTHTGERPYQCQTCPKAFSNKAALLRHERVHTGIKPYQCPKCLKSFTQSNSLKLHFHTVHLKMPTPYKSRRRRDDGKEHVGVDEAALLQAVLQGSEENCYEISTPAGRKINLVPIVPKRMQEQFPIPDPVIREDGTVMYFDVKSEREDPEEQEIIYEVVYE